MSGDIFETLNTDPITGSEILVLLQVGEDDFSNPQRIRQLQDILAFMDGIPDKQFFINKAVGGKDVDKVDHVWELVGLHNKRSDLSSQIDSLDEQIEFFNK